MTLRDLHIGESAHIITVGGEGSLRRHFLDMGILPGAEVKVEKFAPLGDPMQVRLHGYLLTLRLADASKIEVSDVHREKTKRAAIHPSHVTHPHPGLGETGHYHKEDNLRRMAESQAHGETPTATLTPTTTPLSFALVGNQNCGKTTLFNQLTGANQHVGNFPGVTIDYKVGNIRGHEHCTVTDLPGIYSLSPFSAEEVVARDYILDEHPTGIINIVDATNIARNLYLTMQLLELGLPMVLALNMMDELEGNGGTILVNEMEEALGIPVVPISAAKNQGVRELIDHALHVARYHETPKRQDFCDSDDHGGALHRCLHAIMHLVEDHAAAAHIPARFVASKLVEDDTLTAERLHLSPSDHETIERVVRTMEEERGLDRAAAMASMRFSFIANLCEKTVIQPVVSREQQRSVAIDRILTGRFTALPVFALLMAFIFWFTFSSVGEALQSSFEAVIDSSLVNLGAWLQQVGVSEVVRSLVVEGIGGGVGSVLSFLPLIVLLFFWLSMLEDSGYMARIAFVMDKVLRRIGLSGRSVVPMLIGFGCSVPAVMATRTLPSARDRKLTILLTPFMSCTAKLPIYAFLTAAFFPHRAGVIICSLYALGILTGISLSLLLKQTTFRGEAVPFVMELPSYRLPTLRNTLYLMWDKARDFLQRAFTIIFLATIVIWFFQHFDFRFSWLGDDPSHSMLARLAGGISPIFAPLGLDDWRWVTALVSGFLAKESVVASMGVLFPGGSADLPSTALVSLLGSDIQCYTLLVFCLLYTPCSATIATIRRELGLPWASLIVVGQCVIAWLMAYLVHSVLTLVLA